MSTEVECGKCHEVGTESVSYTDKMIRHKLVTGLEDKDILPTRKNWRRWWRLSRARRVARMAGSHWLGLRLGLYRSPRFSR